MSLEILLALPFGFAPLQDAAPATLPTLALSLEEADRRALENNLGFRIEALNSEVALYNHRATWGSFDWVLDARAGYTDAEFQPRDVFGGSSETTRDLSIDFTRPFAVTGGTFKTHLGTTESKTNSAFQVEPRSTTDVISLQYTQPLLRGAWREYATSRQRESEFEARRADEGLRRARQKLLHDVANAYWDLVAARDALGVAETSLGLARAQVDQNQKRFDAGVGTSVEVLQAEAEAATREEGRLKAEVDVKKAADALKLLLVAGKDSALWETEIVPTTSLPEAAERSSAPTWSTAFAVAVDRRADLRQARLSIDAADVRHQRAISDQHAGLDLDLTASSQGFSSHASDAFETTAQFDFPTYRAALVFNYALGNTNASNLERSAWASLRAARLSYDQLETQVAAEVRDAVRQVAYQSEAVRAADKSLELARQQLAAEELRFQNDQSTTFEILRVQSELTQAMSNARRARAELAKSRVVLESAQGLLGETNRP